MTRCLVTGIAGFIGSSIAAGLIRRGIEVRGVDNLSTGKLENLKPMRAAIDFTRGDILDATLMARQLKGVDTVFHQAAVASVQRSIEDPISTHETNVIGTRCLIAAAIRAGVRRIVFASSSAVYGDTVRLPVSEFDRPAPLSPYAAHKLECELMLEHAWLAGQIETVALRYFNVFGPRQSAESAYAGAIVSFIRTMIQPGERGPVTIFGDGSQTRDFIFVNDVVRANLAAMDAPARLAGGAVFNIGTGRRHSLYETACTIAHLIGYERRFNYQPARSGDVRHSLADVRLAAASLGITAETSFRDGLSQTIAHMLTAAHASQAERAAVANVLRARVFPLTFPIALAAQAVPKTRLRTELEHRLAS